MEESPGPKVAGQTVVALDDDELGVGEAAMGIPETDMELQAELEAEANFAASAPQSSIKKRGGPSLSTPATPAKSGVSKTPRSTKSTAAPKSAGRSTGKRKVVEAEAEPEEDEVKPTPAKSRGRPGRPAASSASARLAAKAASKPTRGRPKSTTAAAKPAKKAGRSKASTNGTQDEDGDDEFEVEEIVDSAIDADSMEHMYLVKWKNYSASDNTWEPKKNLKGSLDLVRKFDAKKKKEEAAEAAKKAAAGKKSGPAAAASAGGGNKKATRGRKPKAVKTVKAAKPAKKAPGRPGRPERPAGRRRARA
ncbi:hypothetical protein N658DRAFT_497119 [Parathielavia hyrcaniae]|uniref:Chromo domain-containing protein n=1 Tax=Parathielavia hyrcaniae TaxID=113614 RepID=A0AAN6Q0S9_9PEZI|nr:hypothetical protein N658DRAFT_497119 [Parathielavia hyrcaniae]